MRARPALRPSGVKRGLCALIGGILLLSAIGFPHVNAATEAPLLMPVAHAATAHSDTLTLVSHRYFAEGSTLQSSTVAFSETLSLLNPTSYAAHVLLTYALVNASVMTITRALAPHSVALEDVENDVGSGQQVSIIVASDQPIGVQRIIHRHTATQSLASTTSAGTAHPSTTWYFAEGYSGVTFQPYLVVFNPEPMTTTVSIALATASGPIVLPIVQTLPPFGRSLVNMRAVVPNRSFSIIVHANGPVVAERVEYWGQGNGSAKFGSSISSGMPTPITYGTFASALTTAPDQAYISLYNPFTATATVTATMLSSAGDMGIVTATIAPASRATLLLHTGVTTAPVAVDLVSDQSIAAELAQYVGGSPNSGQHSGWVSEPSSPIATWLLASGDTTAMTETVFIANPSQQIASVIGIAYSPDGESFASTYIVPARSETVVTMNTLSGLPNGFHGSLWSTPNNVGIVIAQMETDTTGHTAWGDAGVPSQ